MKFGKLCVLTRLIRLILQGNYYHTNALQPVFDRKCSQTSTELMFWLSCEVLYNLDQKHMKQGCYIGNTTESLYNAASCLPFLSCCFPLALAFSLTRASSPSVPLQRDGPSPLAASAGDAAGAAGRRTVGGRKMTLVAPGSHICAGPERLADTAVYFWSVLGQQKHFAGVCVSVQDKKHLRFIEFHCFPFIF